MCPVKLLSYYDLGHFLMVSFCWILPCISSVYLLNSMYVFVPLVFTVYVCFSCFFVGFLDPFCFQFSLSYPLPPILVNFSCWTVVIKPVSLLPFYPKDVVSSPPPPNDSKILIYHYSVVTTGLAGSLNSQLSFFFKNDKSLVPSFIKI